MKTSHLDLAAMVSGPPRHPHHAPRPGTARIVRKAGLLALGTLLGWICRAPIGVALAQTGYNPDGAPSGYAGKQNLGVAQVAYYVNGSSSACSNSGPGTQSAPYCTISAALAAHHDPGTTLYVMPGVYHEQVTLPASGVSGSPLVLQGLGSPSNPVVIDGADDFSDPARWTQYSGDVWLAASVTWSPLQVFADNQRLTPSSAPPGSLPARSFEYVAGAGLYVNVGGGNPGTHRAEVGHRLYGVNLSARSWVTIDGFTITRCEARCINLSSSCSNVVIAHNVVTFSGKYGIQVTGGSAVSISSNQVNDNADHGVSMLSGVTNSTFEDNECARNILPSQREANGLYLFGCSNNVIRRNRFHHNQDTGLQIQSGSNNNLSIQNRSWSNGDHGFDHLLATGNVHIGDVAWGNYKDGFSIEGSSTGQTLYDCIAVDNGLTTSEYDLWVEGTSQSGFVSDDNLFWNSVSQPPIKWDGTIYSSVADYSAATGHDTRTLQANPRFVAPAQGDFHLMAGSPAIDAANSGLASWPSADAEGKARVDDPATPNTGRGSITYADRGALEFQPTAGNQPPVARLTVTPSSGTAPLTVSADASASSDPDGTIASYRFDFGDGTVVGPQPGSTATHTYAAGQWTCTVTVTDNNGATGSASAIVTVSSPNQAPVARLTVVPSTGIAPLPVVASGVGSSDPDGSIVSYRFDFGDGTVVGPQSLPTAAHTYAAGRWICTLVVTDNGGATGSASVVVTVSSLGTAAAGEGPQEPLVPRVDPNPVRSRGQLVFSTLRAGPLSVWIFDTSGRLVGRPLHQDLAQAGGHVVAIDGTADDRAPLRGGIYFYRICSAEGSRIGRFVIIR